MIIKHVFILTGLGFGWAALAATTPPAPRAQQHTWRMEDHLNTGDVRRDHFLLKHPEIPQLRLRWIPQPGLVVWEYGTGTRSIPLHVDSASELRSARVVAHPPLGQSLPSVLRSSSYMAALTENGSIWVLTPFGGLILLPRLVAAAAVSVTRLRLDVLTQSSRANATDLGSELLILSDELAPNPTLAVVRLHHKQWAPISLRSSQVHPWSAYELPAWMQGLAASQLRAELAKDSSLLGVRSDNPSSPPWVLNPPDVDHTGKVHQGFLWERAPSQVLQMPLGNEGYQPQRYHWEVAKILDRHGQRLRLMGSRQSRQWAAERDSSLEIHYPGYNRLRAPAVDRTSEPATRRTVPRARPLPPQYPFVISEVPGFENLYVQAMSNGWVALVRESIGSSRRNARPDEVIYELVEVLREPLLAAEREPSVAAPHRDGSLESSAADAPLPWSETLGVNWISPSRREQDLPSVRTNSDGFTTVTLPGALPRRMRWNRSGLQCRLLFLMEGE